MIGVLNINKPKGVTSSQVVVKVKKLLNTSKVGHMGTLDPLASGVLPICVGKATRLFDYFLKKKKTYIAHFTFGTETDTLDLEGKIIKTSKNIPTRIQVEEALKCFEGEINQIPPMYSSKKINGKKAYNLARSGVELNLKPCKVIIYEYVLTQQVNEKTFEFKITCSAGTYIRALARDLGYKLNTCATMTSLLRTASGNFELQNSIDYENLTQEKLINSILPLEVVLADFEKLAISKQNFQKLLNGISLDVNEIKNDLSISNMCKQKLSIEEDTLKNKILNNNSSNNKFLKLNTINNINKTAEQQYYSITVENKIVGIGCILNNNLKIKTYLLDN